MKRTMLVSYVAITGVGETDRGNLATLCNRMTSPSIPLITNHCQRLPRSLLMYDSTPLVSSINQSS